jgi:hypothetical protein
MQIAGAKIHLIGRLQGLTARSVATLVSARQGKLVRRAGAADVAVVSHSRASMWPDVSREPLAKEVVSEMQFRRAVGLVPPVVDEERPYTADKVARLAGLSSDVVESLALFDVLDCVDGLFGFRDLAVAREAGRLLDSGVALNGILQTGSELRVRGLRLNAAKLRETPWGSLATADGEELATVDGQLELPLQEPTTRFDDIFEIAEECEVEGDLEEAERLYRLASSLDPREPFCLFNLGNVLAQAGRDDEAIWAFLHAVARDAAIAGDSYYNVAILHRRNGQFQKAEQAYRKALENSPGHSDARHNLALLLGEQARYEEALAIWEALGKEGNLFARRQAALCRMEIVNAKGST